MGIDTYIYKEYEYVPKRKSISGSVIGHKYKRVGIVAAKLGKKIIEPFEYNGTMSSELFGLLFKKKLLPSLPKNIVIVMYNTYFYCRKDLLCTTNIV